MPYIAPSCLIYAGRLSTRVECAPAIGVAKSLFRSDRAKRKARLQRSNFSNEYFYGETLCGKIIERKIFYNSTSKYFKIKPFVIEISAGQHKGRRFLGF